MVWCSPPSDVLRLLFWYPDIWGAFKLFAMRKVSVRTMQNYKYLSFRYFRTQPSKLAVYFYFERQPLHTIIANIPLFRHFNFACAYFLIIKMTKKCRFLYVGIKQLIYKLENPESTNLVYIKSTRKKAVAFCYLTARITQGKT